MCKDCRQSQRALATKDQSGAVKGSFLVLFRTRAVHCGRLAPRPGFGTPGGSGTPSGTQWWYMAHHGSVSSVGESAVQTVKEIGIKLQRGRILVCFTALMSEYLVH